MSDTPEDFKELILARHKGPAKKAVTGISYEMIQALAQAQLTKKELCAYLGIDVSAYDQVMREAVESGRRQGIAAIKIVVFKMALEGNPQMLKLYAQNYAGMQESPTTQNNFIINHVEAMGDDELMDRCAKILQERAERSMTIEIKKEKQKKLVEK